MKIPLQEGDRVVTAFAYRDVVLVITERGRIFEIAYGDSAS